ncbi:mediator complex subunit 13 C-terminal-domain-containing protein [Clohesyomyces aquaticus]|uniref:Mediator of RNA polymerase II transcription subunit 13 n=1 Tax=Clohesyomyces aquaticus TaxID=1231657 RepID=A0A1Y1YX99_9PLEO|nr:mediator complex subunit 13 C-terminal-domain-containing protein [Clohesyomyces aquaticus]
MEFIKTCNTNAQAIGDFEAVAFQAFSVKRNPTAAASLGDRSPAEDLHAAEAEFRQGQHLVVQDASKSLLWFFRATTADKAGQKPLALPLLKGYDFQAEQSGVMKASELARPPMRNFTFNTPSSTSSSSPSTPGGLKGPGFSSGNVRAAQGTSQSATPLDQHQQHDSYAIYELFTSSVVALISYYLVRDHNATALNYRTFLSKPSVQPDSDEDPPTSHSANVPYCLTNLSVYWTSSGTLVVSVSSVPRPEIRRLSEVESEEAQRDWMGRCVRVAPNGLLAKIVGFESPSEIGVEPLAHRSQRKRVKIGPVEQSIERWKTLVRRWLKWKGYSIADLDDKSSWVKLRMAHLSQVPPASPAPSSPSREVLWPRMLCLFYEELQSTRDGVDVARAPQKERTLEWFETPDSTGFRDPLDVAQQWFMGKSERDQAFEALRKAQKAEEEAAQPKGDNHGLFPSSPLNSRTGAYGDLQAVSGVYPTPPDGVAPGVGLPSSDNSAPPGSGTNTILVPGGSHPAINLSGPQDHPSTDAHQHPAASPENPLPFDQFNSNINGGNDDLFEDLDEDAFGPGNDITDADFSFFDEPDDENVDVDMPDAAAMQDSKPPSQGKPAKENEPSQLPEADIKEELPDPMAALDDALASALHPPNEIDPVVKSEQRAEEPRATEQPPTEKLTSQLTQSDQSSIVAVKYEPSPPLSPRLVQKKLLPSPTDRSVFQTPKHRDSIFDPVSFNRKMSLSDAKYHGGRFSFSIEKPTKIEEPKTVAKRPASLRDLPMLTKLRHAIGMASARATEVKALERADSDISDSSSETSASEEEDPDDVESIGPATILHGIVIPGKRKLPTDGNATPLSTTSFADSFAGDSLEVTGLQTDESCLMWFESNPADWSLTYLPAPAGLPSTLARNDIPTFSPISPSLPDTPTSQPDTPNDLPDEKPLGIKDSIAVAQIITDQIVSATLDILHEGSSPLALSAAERTPCETTVTTVVRKIFPKATDCNVLGLASVQDVFPDLPQQSKGQPRSAPRKINAQADGSASPGHLIYQINSPHIRVRRGDTLWDVLPPALSFWEPLGLAPCNPAKNVVPFCLYPHSHSLTPCLENFLVNIQIAYETCKFGTHARIQTVPEYEGGLVPCRINGHPSTRAAFKVLRETCIQLGKLLAARHAQMREKDDTKVNAFVIYMIDPFDDASALWELCSAFWSLFQAYGQVPSTRPGNDVPPKPDLVLQVVPIKCIASFDVPVILGSSTYVNLAREVYDRCPPSTPSEDKTPLAIYTAPSFQLEESIPRTIPFKLNAEPPQDLLRESSYMHLGYAISLDGTWITVAWTDSCGKSQAVVSYNLGTRSFGEVAKEIWQTTIEILQARRVTWRICIAKSGVMEREELETWVFLASYPTQLNLFITLLTVDTNPPLKFTPAIPSPTAQSTSGTTTQHLSANTPSSTPQTGGVSPDQHGLTPAATPAEPPNDPSSDPDARLVNVTDESWGIILSHRLHNSNSTVDFRPCLISGLLVKRGESYSTSNTTSSAQLPDPERGPIVVGINILWVGAVGSTRAAASPFPPSASGAEGVSPGVVGASTTGGGQERSSTSLTWTPTAQSRATAENLLKEILGQFRALGLLARLKGMRGTRGGTVPWHVVAAKRGVGGLVEALKEKEKDG